MMNTSAGPDQNILEQLSHLATASLLNGLDRASLNEMAQCAKRIILQSGECLLRQGTETGSICFVVQGSLYARQLLPDGQEIILNKIHQGEPIGEIHILTGGVHTADVIACETTELLQWTKNALDSIACKNPDVMARLYEIAGNRLLKDQLTSILHDVFGPLDKTVQDDLQKQAKWIHLPRGDVLFHEGEMGDSLYLVVMGRLRVVTHQSGKEKILGEAAPGESIGEMALMTSEPRSATVYAIRDCELIEFSQALFERLLDAYPKIMTRLIRILIDRLKKQPHQSGASGKVKNIALLPVHESVSIHAFVQRMVDELSCFGKARHLDGALMEKMFPASNNGNTPWTKMRSVHLGAWLYEQETTHEFVLYEADADLTDWTLKCLSQADQIVFIADAADPSGKTCMDPQRIKDISHVSRSMIILHSAAPSTPGTTSRLVKAWNADSHHHIRADNDADFKRVARIFAGKAVSVVLGGGGARALAHIGVIRALREQNIPIDMIGGTSMGALVASWCALGWSDQVILDTVKDIFIKNNLLSDYTLPVVSLVRCRNLDRVMQKGYGDTRIEDLWLNYFCVSSNLTVADVEVHKSGALWKAIRASISLPGIAVPIIQDGDLLIDGGVLNNLPVDIMRSQCRGTTIAVDVSQVEELKVRKQEFPSPWTMFYERWLKKGAHSEFPTILDILMRTAELTAIQQRRKTIEAADLYLRPPVNDFRLLDFERFDELVDIGYRYTKKEIARWEKEGLLEKYMA